MAYLVLIVLADIGLGVAAGWFLSLPVLAVLTAVNIFVVLRLLYQSSKSAPTPTGFAGAVGAILVFIVLGLFTLSMWVTALVARAGSISAGFGLSGQSIADFFLR